ncbi:MAG TPA: cytochrome b/b6 domain-containing protein [Bryobacteraceae bacterium]|jgi:thiosulfate reductase cytochrome b subunit|nr:cytochrome b/b6 domain-containing protein [Bryobacteraceae bacterium]
MQNLKLKHLLAIRWFHWINFPLLFLMIWSGILIYWAYSPYHIGSFHFFPAWFVATFHTDHRLADGMALHFTLMWLFVLNGVAYVVYTLVSGEWKYLVPKSFSAFRDAWDVVLHDLGMRQTAPPQEKYNAAQQISYTAIVVMGVGSVITGLAIYKPAQLAWLTALCGGYTMARLIHFTLTIGYVLFFVVHVAQVIRAGWNNFRSMVIGYEMADEQK